MLFDELGNFALFAGFSKRCHQPGTLSGRSGVATIMPKLNATRKNAQKAHIKNANQVAIGQYVHGSFMETLGDTTSSGSETIESAKPPKQARLVKLRKRS